MFEKITEAEIDERSMARVSTTPNRKTAFGEGEMDAKALKLRFDRLPRFIISRLNEVMEGMANGRFAERLYIDVPGSPPQELAAFIISLRNGQLTQINVNTPSGNGNLEQVCDIVYRINNGLSTGDFADDINIAGNLTLSGFYKKFLELEGKVKVPVVGVDYFTQADKEEIVRNVIASLPVYEGEVVQE